MCEAGGMAEDLWGPPCLLFLLLGLCGTSKYEYVRTDEAKWVLSFQVAILAPCELLGGLSGASRAYLKSLHYIVWFKYSNVILLSC